MNIYLRIWATVTSEPILPTAKPNTVPTADPTIDPTVNPCAELWPTPTPTGILSLEVNIKKQKWLLNIYLRIWLTVISAKISSTDKTNAEPTADPSINLTSNTTDKSLNNNTNCRIMCNTNSNRYFIAWTQYSKINWRLNIYLHILVNEPSAPARHNQLQRKLQIQLLMQLLTQK